jgi:protocatechuate 3,4-dioxygenase beta subunit
MNEEAGHSGLRVGRRRALGIGGAVGLTGVLAACAGSDEVGSDEVVALLDKANTCMLNEEEIPGPYWFDVDSIRSDIREDRPGTPLILAVRVRDVTGCSSGGTTPTPVANAVVEIWHCDAGGIYSGFESDSRARNGGAPPVGPPPPGGPPAGAGAPDGTASGKTSNGAYSVGDVEGNTTDELTYLRGAQVTDAAGIARFTTIYPGWYRSRTVHIHLKAHVNKKTVLTTQLYFDDALNDAVHTAAPYNAHTGRDTRNNTDRFIDQAAGLIAVTQRSGGYLGAINLGVHV